MFRSVITNGIRHCIRRFRNDLERDSYLPVLLVCAAIICGFWFFHLIPNFATQDEHARLLDVFPLLGGLVADPGLQALSNGITQGRLYGATLYLNLLAMLPAIAYAVFTGQMELFLPFYQPDNPINTWAGDTDLWWLWHSTPEWVWSSSLLLLRLFAVVFAVVSVYLCYRIGTELRNRYTGRLAGTLLALTFGFVVTAHEGGEDVPMVCLLLLTVYLSLRYLSTGNRRYILAGCVSGAVVIGLKLTGGIAVVALGAALVLRGYRDRSPDDSLFKSIQPRLVLACLTLGAVVVVLGYPSVLFSGPEAFIDRITRGTTNKSGSAGGRVAPSWWWIVRGYANGYGLPLMIGSIGGLIGLGPLLARREQSFDGLVVLTSTLAACFVLISWWSYVRVHHLLPTMVLLVIVLAVVLADLVSRTSWSGRAIVAVLLVSSALYSGVGTMGYADQPRENAANWLSEAAGPTDAVEVYERDMQDSAVPHGMTTSHYRHRYPNGTLAHTDQPEAQWQRNIEQRCPAYVLLTWDDLRHLASPAQTPNAKSSETPFAKHVAALVSTNDGEYTAYEPVKSFGPTPTWLNGTQSVGLPELLRVGIVPRTIQYGDEQNLGPEGYVLIIKRTAPCTP